MSLSKLERRQDGSFSCPVCGGGLEYVDGGAVSVVDGKLDMEAIKPKYECEKCNVYYREVMSTGYYDVFPLKRSRKKSGASSKKEDVLSPCSQDPVALKKQSDGTSICPNCRQPLRFVEGGAVRVVDGKVDMDNIKPKYECDNCNVFYREVLNSGFYHAYPLVEGKKSKKSGKKIMATGDLPPLMLRKDANGKCECPRCGELMDFVEGGAVTIVDGKPDMENVKAHFVCDNCHSVYRKIVNTDFYQWAEK